MRKRTVLLAAIGVATTARFLLRRVPEIRDAVVLITGGSRGLGLAIAFECGRRGATPVLCARDGEELERAVGMLAGNGIAAGSFVTDVRDAAQAKSLVASVVAAHGRIDALVNNAGIIAVAPQSAMHRDDYEDALATHFWGAYNTIDAALPHFRERGRGRIANISSIGGKISVPHLLAYSTSKFALAGYSEGLRTELARENISVTTVYPGLMRTGSPRNALFGGNASAEYTWFKISDTMPGISVSAASAARAIVDATARRDATLTISTLAKFGSLAHAIVPNLTARVLGLAAAMLPAAPDTAAPEQKGWQEENALTRSPLTVLGERPERTLNERGEGT
ncbi:MAG: SDR family oxidoreductase [Candidatus Eremiobacteraeota bacterium]|nr:SDR family oxidoreductase [Candidatus Eremiobacteraeota bacterium]